MRTKLTRNLQLGFGLSLLFLISISIASYESIHNLFESSDLVDHSNQVIQKLDYTMSTMKDAETGQRGFLLTGANEFLDPYRGSYNKAIKFVNEFQDLTQDNPQQQQTGAAIKEILLKRLNILQRLIDKKQAGKPITTDDMHAGKLAMDSLRRAIDKAEVDERKLLHDRLAALERYTLQTPLFLIFAALVAIVITLFSYFRIVRGIAERARLYDALKSKEMETAAINEELAAANEEINATNEELASANEELAAANEEIRTTNEDLATVNEELNASNEDLAAANEELNAANEQLTEAQDDVRNLNEKLSASNEELSATVDELHKSQSGLRNLNEELEQRVEKRTKALADSEGRFKVMMATMPQMAWTNTPDGEINFFNKLWYEYTGLTFEQSKGWGWTVSVHPDDLAEASKKYQAALETGAEGEFEARKKRFDGAFRWHLIRMQPVKSEDGVIQLWVGTATDIHDLKNLQQQKDDFISIASHELKTPITSLKASLQLLDRIKDEPTSQTVPRLIGQANKSLTRLNVLVEDLLNVSKLNHGQLNLHKTQFNLYQLVSDCCQYIRIEEVYSVLIKGDNTLYAYGDERQVEQVLTNLLNNAMKYAPSSKEINIKIEKTDGMAKVSVTDKGPGISPEKVPHLFDRYFRVDSTGIQFSGLGLGLYISAEIVKKHDGQIGVDTEVGKGSTFWFTIPLKG